MSDTSQGEGWWTASDGKWYPPESHPDYEPLPPPPAAAEASVAVEYPPPGDSSSAGGAKPPWWRRRWVIVTFVVIVALVILGAIFGGTEEEPVASTADNAAPAVSDSDVPQEATEVEEPAEDEPAPGPTSTPTSTSTTSTTTTTTTTTTTLPPLPGFGSGTRLVGLDFEPGRYVAEDVSSCYWERLSGLSGELGDIIANNNVDGRAIVDIAAGDEAFNSTRCGDWTIIVAPNDGPGTTMGPGSWQIGIDIVAGRWATTGEVNGCYWQRVSNFGGDLNAIIANDNVDGRAIVDIAAGDAGFESTRCGEWELLG